MAGMGAPLPRRALADAESGDRFDSGTLVTNPDLVVDGDEMRFYYGAYSSGAIGGGSNITGDQQTSGVGLVTLPLDRFAGLRSEPQPPTAKVKMPPDIGQITLKPMTLTADSILEINADADEGEVRVELLDKSGYRVPGFERENALPVSKDEVRAAVGWKAREDGKIPAGRYHLRIHLRSATIYALTLRHHTEVEVLCHETVPACRPPRVLPLRTPRRRAGLLRLRRPRHPWRDNVSVTPVTAEKHPGNPVLRRGPEGAPDHGHAILYGTV